MKEHFFFPDQKRKRKKLLVTCLSFKLHSIQLAYCSHSFLGNCLMTFGESFCRIFDLHVTFTRKLINFLRMSIMQISSCNPSICLRHNSISLRLPTKPCILPIRAKHVLRNPLVATCKTSVQQRCMTVLKNNRCRVASTSQHSLPVCLLGGKGKNGSDNEVRHFL